MITPRQYAEQFEMPYSTVMRWLQRNLIPGVQKQELPSGGWYYTIPSDAPKPDLKPGPKVKTDGEVSTATDAPDDGAPGAAVGEGKPVKKTRRKGSDQ